MCHFLGVLKIWKWKVIKFDFFGGSKKWVNFELKNLLAGGSKNGVPKRRKHKESALNPFWGFQENRSKRWSILESKSGSEKWPLQKPHLSSSSFTPLPQKRVTLKKCLAIFDTSDQKVTKTSFLTKMEKTENYEKLVFFDIQKCHVWLFWSKHRRQALEVVRKGVQKWVKMGHLGYTMKTCFMCVSA